MRLFRVEQSDRHRSVPHHPIENCYFKLFHTRRKLCSDESGRLSHPLMSDTRISLVNVVRLCYATYVCFCVGFERPSAIQQRAIKPMIKGRDVIAQAQSGTGKTATFSIAMLQSIDTQLRDTQVLCLSPTRELAVQIQKVNVYLCMIS